jgi:hypothetical protein
MKAFLNGGAIVATAILAACSGSTNSTDASGGAMSSGATSSAASPSPGSGSAATGSSATHVRAASGTAQSGGRELVNPDASTVVFLYYQLAHLPLPIDTWVEEDSRVKFAPAPEKAAHRESVRAELNAAAASVQDVDALRLTLNANLSEYDPSYGEFTVRAIAPSSVLNFDALGQKVTVNFTNGRTAQIWRVPPADAQGVRDKINPNGNVEIDALLRIANVFPGPGGGTIATEVVEYELRDTQRGMVLARVQVAGQGESK